MHLNLREKIDVALFILLCICAFAPLIQLAVVPSSMMLKVIPNLSCDFYGGSRAGWGCAKWSDIFTNPLPTELASLLSLLILLLLGFVRRKALPWRYIFYVLATQSLFACGFGGVIRFFHFLTGVANNTYLIQTVPIIGVALVSFFVVIYVRADPRAAERQRRSRQEVYIEAEIAERMKEERAKK